LFKLKIGTSGIIVGGGNQLMRYVFSLSLFGMILLTAFNTGAQENVATSALSSSNLYATLAPPAPVSQNNVSTFALTSLISDTSFGAPAPLAQTVFMPGIFANPTPLAPSPAPEPQEVQGVFENYAWQAYVGYTFVRFYELPSVAENQNGANASVTWYYRDWLGFDIEALGAHGTLGGASSWTMFVGGGPRLRTSLGRNLEVFGHALIGGAYFSPDTPFGSQGAFGYELGGGVDLKPNHSRFALRVEGDVLGTRFFQTNQWSPKVSAGVVFNF
jgi:hypothetical protein